MKKLKNFQKFALSAKQANDVRGGIRCFFQLGSGQLIYFDFNHAENAAGACNDSCVGCF